MGLLTESFVTVVTITRELDGRIFDYASQTWLPATEVSKVAADTAIGETISAIVDLVPFPLEISLFGIVKFDIDRGQMDASLSKIQNAIRIYVGVTTS